MRNDPGRELALFAAALELPAGERAAFLDQACAGHDELRRRVEILLQAHDRTGDFLEGLAGDMAMEARPVTTVGEQPGDRIGRYKLLEPIGEGGCGVVFMAEQEEPVRRRVALKIIKPGMDTRSVIGRFEAERQALALMDHPSIAKVFDAGATESGRPYFVMELVRGVKITDYCDQRALTTQERLGLFVQVCQAVQHAHQKGIIHRDIKPSNILVTETLEGAPLPVVIDFGIAKATTNQRLTEKTLFTEFEMLIGTPAYMSPEQAALTSTDVDTRSDIYSLGVLLYELLTGATPFDTVELLKAGLDEVRRVLREQEPLRPSTRLGKLSATELGAVAGRRRSEPRRLVRQVRGDLDWIVMRSLEKNRARRYETASALALDVQRFLSHETVAAGPPSSLYRLGKLARRNKLLFTSLGVIAVLLVTALALVTFSLAREREAHRQADRARAQAEADKSKAQTEAAKSQQVVLFLQEMLEGAAPNAALGRDTTVLREVLDRADARLARELGHQPAVEADLRLTLGQVYEDLGAYPQAGDMLRRALELNRQRLPEASPPVAITLTRLGRVLLRAQKLEEADSHTRAALAIWQKLRDEEGFEATVTLETLAMVRWQQKKPAEAEPLLRQALDLRRHLLPEDSPEVLNALNNLGNVLHGAGKFPEAEQLYRQLVEAKRNRYGNEHPSVAVALQNLGAVLVEQGKLAEAREQLGLALVMRRKLLGNQHPDYARSLFSLAEALQRSQDHSNSETLYREALALEQKRVGKDDPMVLRLARHLAAVLVAQRKNQEAVRLLDGFLTPEFARTPGSVALLSTRAEAQACLGNWNGAAADAAQAIEHEPANHEHYHTLAPLLVASENLAAYRQLCGQIITRFHDTASVSTADRMAKDCLIHPASGVDLKPVAALAVLAVTKGANWPAFPFFQVCKALAEYRQRNFLVAVEWAGKAGESTFPYVTIEAGAVLAMAQHQLQQREAARASLARASAVFEAKLPKLTGGDLGADWRDWIIARALLTEARTLIEGAAGPELTAPL